MPQGKGARPQAKKSSAVQARAARVPKKSPKSNKSHKSRRNPRPPRAVRLSQAERRYQPAPSPPRRPGVSVTIHIGGVRLPPKLSARIRSLATAASRRLQPVYRLLARVPLPAKYRRPVLGAVVIAACLTVVFAVRGVGGITHSPTPVTGTVAAAPRTVPDFKPLLPSAEQASATHYDGKRNLVSYSTTFSGARLTVSQQPVPAKFSQDPMALRAAADSIQAKQRIDTARGPVYIATNEAQDQLAVYASRDVLVFIHTDRKMDDISWKSFIEQLKAG